MLEFLKEKLRSLKSDRFWERPTKLEITQSTRSILVWGISKSLELDPKLILESIQNRRWVNTERTSKNAQVHYIRKHLTVFGTSCFNQNKVPLDKYKALKSLYLYQLASTISVSSTFISPESYSQENPNIN